MRNCIILGSGRSGTSLMCGLLNKCGYYMGDDLIAPDKSNPGGYFESLKINTLNEEILISYVKKRLPGILGSVLTPARTYYFQSWLTAIDKRIEILSSDFFDQRIKYFTAQTPFCFKDPRFSYTLPAWMNNLPADTVFICVFRNPEDVVASMVKEAQRDAAIRGVKLKFGKKEAMAVWLAMYEHVLKAYYKTENKNNWSFINYEQIIANDPRLEDIENKLGVKMDRTFIDATLDHSQKESPVFNDEKIARTYQLLFELSDLH